MLEDLLNLSKTNLTDKQAVLASGLQLEKIVLPLVDKLTSDEQTQVIAELERLKALEKLQALYEVYETFLENDFEAEIFNSVVDWSGLEKYILYGRFVGLIKNELALAKVEEPNKVAFIGSGPLPITALLVNKLSGAHVTCYEHYLPAAKISSEFIAKLGMQNDIDVQYRPGQQIDASGYDAVIIALLAKPKLSILKQIRATAKADCRVVCRYSEGLRQVFYETTLPTDMPGFKIVGKKHARGPQTISTMLLKAI